MPELPEVESIRLRLKIYLIGHKVENVKVNYAKALQGDENELVGGKVVAIRRFGKVLSVDLDNGFSVVIHIKLTGQLIYRGPNLKKVPNLSEKVVGGVPGKHTHVVFELDRNGRLFYNDIRKFGWIKIVKTAEVEDIDFIKNLGPEPLVASSSGQASLTLEKFKEIVGSTKRAIKTLLMDQKKIGGVGNIYANDALWLAKIHPEKSSNKLKMDEIERLYEAVEKVLKKGLKYGGASELSFVVPSGEEGSYQDHTFVYGKEGKPCKRHKSEKIKKIKIGGRGTYYCPVCQTN